MMTNFPWLIIFPWENLVSLICNNLQQESNAIFPKHIIILIRFNINNSSFRYDEQLASSSFSGLFCGGAHRTDAVTYALIKLKPSASFSLVDLVAKPFS